MTNKVILLVEDNDDTRAVYSMVLKHAGYDVLEAIDGITAMNMALKHQPRLVLLDISIPGVDGMSVGAWIKANAQTAGTLVVALTAYDGQADRDLAAHLGFDDYLAKPIEPRDVLVAVSRFLHDPSVQVQA
jgi:CheY-like chemotaxis protein